MKKNRLFIFALFILSATFITAICNAQQCGKTQAKNDCESVYLETTQGGCAKLFKGECCDIGNKCLTESSCSGFSDCVKSCVQQGGGSKKYAACSQECTAKSPMTPAGKKAFDEMIACASQCVKSQRADCTPYTW